MRNIIIIILILCLLPFKIIMGQKKDILEVARFPMPNIMLWEFSNDGKSAMSYNTQKQLQLWNIKTGDTIMNFGTIDQNIDQIVFSPNGTFAFTIGSQVINLWSIDTPSLLYTFINNSSIDLSISPNSQQYISCNHNNNFDVVDILIKQGNNYNMPTHFPNKGYYSKLKKALWKQDDNIFLVDVGYGQEINGLSQGIHINIVNFNLNTKQFSEPIAVYESLEINESPSDFTACAITPNKRFLVFCIKNKIVYYDLILKERKENKNNEYVNKIIFDKAGTLMLTAGLNTTTLWDFTPFNTFRRLKIFIGDASTLTFTEDKKYIITFSKKINHLIALDIKEAILIRTNPSKYIKRSAQKKAKVDFLNWLIIKPRETKNQFVKRTGLANQESKRRELLAAAFKGYSAEVFGIGIDYLYIQELNESGGMVKIQTEGIKGINFQLSDTVESRKFIEYFTQGAYKWRNLKLGLVDNDVVIVTCILHMNYGKDYFYNYLEDPENNTITNMLFKPTFEDYDLNSEKIE